MNQIVPSFTLISHDQRHLNHLNYPVQQMSLSTVLHSVQTCTALENKLLEHVFTSSNFEIQGEVKEWKFPFPTDKY